MSHSDVLLKIPVATIVLLFVGVIASVIVWISPQELLRAFRETEFAFAIGLSLITATAASSMATLLAIPIAYSMSRGLIPGGRLVEILLLVPFGMPPVAVGVALLVFFTSTPIGGFIDQLLEIVFTPKGLVVAQFFVVYPMAIRILKNSFAAIDPRYEAVARTLGCTRITALTQVLLPMAKRGILSAYLLAFTRSLGEFGASVTVAGAIKGRTETLPIAMYLAITGGDLGLAVALMLVSIIVAGVAVAALLVLEKNEPSLV